MRHRRSMSLFVPPSKRGGPELGSVEKRPNTVRPHEVAGDERTLPISLSQHLCMLRSTKERDVKRPDVLGIVGSAAECKKSVK
ncbi:hypothetical protein E2C01_052669 [Portunus trituberculatus]|uniref:Uncharacterized protein n=1 Tax=Portunus trituberculatus TaxID=210409 RepID=A0A5B7GIA7_PORTR|nr:hypothetical protein [Portunus trituberculatus]